MNKSNLKKYSINILGWCLIAIVGYWYSNMAYLQGVIDGTYIGEKRLSAMMYVNAKGNSTDGIDPFEIFDGYKLQKPPSIPLIMYGVSSQRKELIINASENYDVAFLNGISPREVLSISSTTSK
jgi:hypothetical protein